MSAHDRRSEKTTDDAADRTTIESFGDQLATSIRLRLGTDSDGCVHYHRPAADEIVVEDGDGLEEYDLDGDGVAAWVAFVDEEADREWADLTWRGRKHLGLEDVDAGRGP